MIYRMSWRKASEADDHGTKYLRAGDTYSIGRSARCDIVLPDDSVSRVHAYIGLMENGVWIDDHDSRNGTLLSGSRVTSTEWRAGQVVRIGDFELQLIAEEDAATAGSNENAIGTSFPPPAMDKAIVNAAELARGAGEIEEVDYVALGGGIGSFVWVDHLRIFGVAAEKIRAIGVSGKPYAKYADLCANSQIPLNERLRSNSLSAPDNIWGFPGYASRETWRDVKRGKLGGIKYVFQVFGEPTLAESYTPRAGDVFRSMDREARRIGWDRIWRPGRILRVRKTNDGRFAIAHRVPVGNAANEARDRIVICRHLHVATGYPAARFLPDLQEFKNKNPTSPRVVNAYDPHDAVYEDLDENGGTILVRGRGIVASRIIQRVFEGRAKGQDIRILHVLRSPIKTGRKYDLAGRYAAHDIEYQPFNWPKACWGGTLRQRLEDATPEQRNDLMASWGGTTTADRADWDAILEQGKREAWYRPFFGDVSEIRPTDNGIITSLNSNQEFQEKVQLDAHYVIDCTGLIADLEASPLLDDMIKTYSLARNRVGRAGPETRLAGLAVSNSFEVEGLRNDTGSVFAAGVLTQNGPYAAVDSFLGLQYAALRSVKALRSSRAPGLKRLGPLRSAYQWLKWCANRQP